MWRFTRFGNRLNTLSVALFSASVLMILYACADSTGLGSKIRSADLGIMIVEYFYPDSLKYPEAGPPAARLSPSGASTSRGVSANIVAPGSASLSSSSPLATYTVSAVPFAPESAPTKKFDKVCDDCVFANVPLGFSFTYFGNVYDKINVGSNGIVGFGPVDKDGHPLYQRDGCCTSGFIPRNDVNNNIIAIGWSRWISTTLNSIRYETRGTAPNRLFLLQYTNVMESGQNGHMTAQLVLYEHSNDIVIHTTELNALFRTHTLTQGIENLAGTEAYYVAGRDSAHFALANESVKFAVTATNQAPFITAPVDIAVNTDAKACAANVKVGVATATDDAAGVTVSGVRRDGLALDAAYPKGVTTITWTATDVEDVKSSAPQTVTVTDNENPVVTAPENKSVRTNKGVSFASVDVGTATAADNCPNVTVTGARSDNALLIAGYPLGVTTITWTAKDAAGNLGTATQTVTVHANQPPVFTSAPLAISASTDPGVCSANVSPSAPNATDDLVGGAITIVGVRNDAKDLHSPYPKGLTVITWTATDAEDASSSVTQSVTVSDKEKPSIVAPENRSVGNDRGLATATVAIGSAEVKDNCPNVSVSAARSDGLSLGSPYPVGSTTITWKAGDASENSNTAVQTVVVSDVEAPSVSVPANMTVNATSASGALVSYSPSARDNIGVTSLSCVRASGNQFPIGPNVVECTASDAAGNRASARFTVTVLGARDQLVNLLAYVQSLGLPNGTLQPLSNQLEAALRALDSEPQVACTKLNDFMRLANNKLSVPAGFSVMAASQTHMVGDAQRICGVLGCR
jgi:HYR domain